MGDWISDLLIFSAGIAGGILVTSVAPSLRARKRRRTELVNARERLLAEIKQQHEKDILYQAFRTTEDIRGELDKSLQILRKTLTAVRGPERSSAPDPHAVQLSEPLEPR